MKTITLNSFERGTIITLHMSKKLKGSIQTLSELHSLPESLRLTEEEKTTIDYREEPNPETPGDNNVLVNAGKAEALSVDFEMSDSVLGSIKDAIDLLEKGSVLSSADTSYITLYGKVSSALDLESEL